MTDRELMQQALDALEQYVGVVISVNDPNDWTPKVADAGEPARKAIEALRERLAQPEQDPVATVYDAYDTTGIDWHCKDAPATGTKLYTAPPQPKTKQEPVAWVECDGELVWNNHEAAIGRNLYTAPPQREWQGLTDEQVKQIEMSASSTLSAIYITEAQLKGKNAL